MATHAKQTDQEEVLKDYGTTIVELAQRRDGTWEATQSGLDIVGTGNSAARATEDMAGQIAEALETED